MKNLVLVENVFFTSQLHFILNESNLLRSWLADSSNFYFIFLHWIVRGILLLYKDAILDYNYSGSNQLHMWAENLTYSIGIILYAQVNIHFLLFVCHDKK